MAFTSNPAGLEPLGYADIEPRLDFAQLFGRNAPVEVEIGCGRGDFLLAYAAKHPETNFLGLERKLVIARKAASKVARAGLRNVRIVHGEVFYLFERYFPPKSLAAIHCYFPDPWPKKRHAKRRLFKPETPQILESLLCPGGTIHIRTDVLTYFETIREVFGNAAHFQEIETPVELAACSTGFERRFMEVGKPIYRVSYRLVASASPRLQPVGNRENG